MGALQALLAQYMNQKKVNEKLFPLLVDLGLGTLTVHAE